MVVFITTKRYCTVQSSLALLMPSVFHFLVIIFAAITNAVHSNHYAFKNSTFIHFTEPARIVFLPAPSLAPAEICFLI